MNGASALRRSSIDATIAASLLLLVPFRLMLIGLTFPRTVILLACYGGIAGLSIAATTRVAPLRRMSRSAATAIGIGAVGAAFLWSAPAPARPLDAIAIVLGVAAAVAEEALFRGLLFQRFERYGAMAAIAVSAAVFASIHVPLYGTSVLPVDLAAGVLLGWQRWATGGWGSSAATHAAANILAVIR